MAPSFKDDRKMKLALVWSASIWAATTELMPTPVRERGPKVGRG
jgi:hypothetical protein